MENVSRETIEDVMKNVTNKVINIEWVDNAGMTTEKTKYKTLSTMPTKYRCLPYEAVVPIGKRIIFFVRDRYLL